MTDKINEKVINIFKKHKKNEPLICNEEINQCKEGFPYVCFKSDDNGKRFNKAHLIEKSNNCYYIVKVLIDNSISPYIYNFKIAGEELLDFLKPYINKEKEGQIVEIDKFYPEEWA